MKPQRPFAFIQSWGCYPVETMIIVGTRDKNHVREFAKACNIKDAVIKDVYTWMEDNFVGVESDSGQYLQIDAGGCVFTAIFLKEWPKKAEWGHYETLMHELHHAVNDCLVEKRGMGKEWEAQAYCQERLFHTIRRKLDGLEKVEKHYLKGKKK